MQSIEDTDTFNGSLDDGQSATLTVDTRTADEVVLFIDDGTTDGTPAAYDLTTRVRSPEFDRFQFYADEAGVQFRSLEDPAYGPEMEYELTNTSGTNGQTYTARLVSVEEGPA